MKRDKEASYIIRCRDVQPLAGCDSVILAGAIVCYWMQRFDELWVDMDDVGGVGARQSFHATRDPVFLTPVFRQCSEEETAARFGQIDLAERAIPQGM